MKKFSLRQVLLFCLVSVLLVVALEALAWRAGYMQQAKSVLTRIGLFPRQYRGSIPSLHRVKKTTLLNTLIDKYNYRSYLEIGQGERTANFDWVNAVIKIGVDPKRSLNAAYQMTSDEFFAVNTASFDLIFVDGLHTAEQVEKDILNSLAILNPNGTIVVHDCNPGTEKMQTVPPPKKGLWTGDVWKGWVKLRATRPDLKMSVIDAENGLGIIRWGRQELISLPESLTYEWLSQNRPKALNLVDPDSFLKELNGDPTPNSVRMP